MGMGLTPSSWEGWLVTLGFILVLFWRALYAEKNRWFILELGVLIVVLVWVCKEKTEGDWKWRWG